MGLYIFYLVFIVSIAYLYYAQKKQKLTSAKYLFAFLMYVAIFIGIGDMIGGYDRYIYGEMFDTIADEMRGLRDFKRLVYLINGQEYGYFFWEIIVSYFTANRYIFILATTIMMYLVYFYIIKSYTSNYPMACIVFLGFFFFFTITYLRQTMAVGIAWLSVKYIYDRKFFKFMFLLILAASFHNSALVFFPMYFISNRRYHDYVVVLFFFTCLLIGLTSIPSFLLSFAGENMAMDVRTARYSNEFVGVRFDYILEVSFFVWIYIRNKVVIPRDKWTTLFLNMSIFFCGILLLFLRFGQGGRFGWYYIFGLIYMLTTLSDNRKSLRGMKVFVIIVSFALFSRIANAWAFNLTPYKTFFTNGLTAGDKAIYEDWEYDRNYTVNKLYR